MVTSNFLKYANKELIKQLNISAGDDSFKSKEAKNYIQYLSDVIVKQINGI